MRIIFSLLLVVFVLSPSFSLQAQTLGFGVGLSTPEQYISDIYNLKNIDNIRGSVDAAATLGYNFQMRALVPMSDGVFFTLGVGLHRFPFEDSEITIPDPRDPSRNITFLVENNQNVIPISAGIEYTLFRKFLGLYVAGEASYNYFANSIATKSLPVDLPVEGTTFSRVGIGVGAGIDVSLGLVTLDLAARYNIANFIGKEDGEKQKNFLSLTLMAYFGSKSSSK